MGERELKLEGVGRTLPPAELKLCEDGRVLFRYLVEGGDYPGFDSQWREVSEEEQRQHLHMGGKIGEWLKSLKK